MARLRTRVERAAALHRQAAAAATAATRAIEAYSPAFAPAAQYAEQRALAGRLRATAADLAPGWLGASLDAAAVATPLGGATVPAYIRLGLARPLEDVHFPVVVPLLGTGHVAIDADARDARVAGLLRSLILRLLASSRPGSVRMRVVDAACRGETIAAFAGASGLIPPPAVDHPGLGAVLAEANTWVQSPRRADEYFVLVIASMPELTDGRDLAHIARLARIGVSHRLHLISTGWPPPPLTAETTQPPLPNSTQISLRNPHAWVGDPPGATYAGSGVGPARLNSPAYLDPDPPFELVQRVLKIAAGPGQVDGAEWFPPGQRWIDYVSAAQRLDVVRREAAKVVAEHATLVKRARTELAALHGQLGGQQARIIDLVHGGLPVVLKPDPAERSAADSTLQGLVQATAARSTRAQSGGAGAPFRVENAASPGGWVPGGKPGATTGATTQFPAPYGRSGGPPPSGSPVTNAPRHTTGEIRHEPVRGGPASPRQSSEGRADSQGRQGPSGPHPTVGRPNAAQPHADRTPSSSGAPPIPLAGGRDSRPESNMPATTAAPARDTPATTHGMTMGTPAPHPGAFPQAPPGQQAQPGAAIQTNTFSPYPSGTAENPTGGMAQQVPGGPPQAGATSPQGPRPVVRPWGPPVSGLPNPAFFNSGAFAVVGASPTGRMRSAGGQGGRIDIPPLATSPRLPEAALTLIGQARAAINRADAELFDVDRRLSRSPQFRNAAVYGGYALLFALVQIPMLAALGTSPGLGAVVSAPCGLLLVLLSFWLAWLTIGAAYREPGGQKPQRTSLIGAAISLLAATPALLTALWAVLSAIDH